MKGNIRFVKKIWDEAPHNAFTDLIRFGDRWICAFREAQEHERGSIGNLCLIESRDGNTWKLLKRFYSSDHDLRDPKLSLLPSGHLLLLCGSISYEPGQTIQDVHSLTAHSLDGKSWSPLRPILSPGDWLWKITWFQGKGYGFAYQPQKRKMGKMIFCETADGVNVFPIQEFSFRHFPSEGALFFRENGEAYALLRCDEKTKWHTLFGRSSPPFRRWTWKRCPLYLGGPDLALVPPQRIVAGGREILSTPYGLFAQVILATLEKDLHPFLALPSGGDCSYPGMIVYEDSLWMSYYSSHEDKTAIYFANVDFRSS